jgi:PHP family Zn ribbon phosphoesterase
LRNVALHEDFAYLDASNSLSNTLAEIDREFVSLQLKWVMKQKEQALKERITNRIGKFMRETYGVPF